MKYGMLKTNNISFEVHDGEIISGEKWLWKINYRQTNNWEFKIKKAISLLTI